MGRKPKAPRVESVSTVTGGDSHVETMARMENQGNIPAKQKGKKNMNVFVRRSGRLKSSSEMPNNEMMVEEIDIVDSEGQNEPRVEELNNEPRVEELSNELKEPHIEELSTEQISIQGGLGEKIDFIVQSVNEFKSMVTNIAFPSEPQFAGIDYKSLYIDSQKKIDSLVDENHELVKKLEFFRGKVEAYEQMNIGNFKEMMLYSNLSKVTEAVLNLSSQAGIAKFNLPVAGSPAAVANNDNLPAVASPTATNGDEPMASSEEKKRCRKNPRC